MIRLRMRGASVALAVSAAVAAAPAFFVGYQRFGRHAPISNALLTLTLACAVLPWLSRLAAHLTYRAALDDIALHVAGEAVPWNTITRATLLRGLRRDVLVVERGRTAKVILVTRDLFAGRLEPMDELRTRLAAHGHAIA
jgi:hypothetical protein